MVEYSQSLRIGTIPSTIGSLVALKDLEMYNNCLTGLSFWIDL